MIVSASERIRAGCTCNRAGICIRCIASQVIDDLELELERVNSMLDLACAHINEAEREIDALKKERI